MHDAIYEYLWQCFEQRVDPTHNSIAHQFNLTLPEVKQHLKMLWADGRLYRGSLVPRERVVIGAMQRSGKQRQRRIMKVSSHREAREQAILAFIDTYITERRISPTLEQIAAAVGLRAKSNVKLYIDRLVESGKLNREGRAVWLEKGGGTACIAMPPVAD